MGKYSIACVLADKLGFLSINEYLQAASGPPNIFAVGDVATSTVYPRPKAGVFAVRQGPPLTDNIRRSVVYFSYMTIPSNSSSRSSSLMCILILSNLHCKCIYIGVSRLAVHTSSCDMHRQQKLCDMHEQKETCGSLCCASCMVIRDRHVVWHDGLKAVHLP